MLDVLATIGIVGTLLLVTPAHATPVHPVDDAEVVEVLPATGGNREERQWRRELASRPTDPVVATAAARRRRLAPL